MEFGSKRKRPLRRGQGMEHGSWIYGTYLMDVFAILETVSICLPMTLNSDPFSGPSFPTSASFSHLSLSFF